MLSLPGPGYGKEIHRTGLSRMKMTCLFQNHVTHKEEGLSSKFQSRFNMKQQLSSHTILRKQPSSWLHYSMYHSL